MTKWTCNPKLDPKTCPINRWDFKLDTSMIMTTGTKKFNNFGYIAGSPTDNTIYVVFRGTDNARNWITNFNSLKT